MAIEEIKKRIDELQKRYNAASKKKSEFAGQLGAKKEELRNLCAEIEAAGYKPKNLKEEKERVEQELLATLTSCEKELSEVEQALQEFDKK